MRALKYVFVFILVIVLFCVAMVPRENGYLLRKNYLGFVNKLNQQQGIYHIDVLSYRLGWFSSNVKLHLTMKNPQSKDSGFLIDQHISHGPYVYDSRQGWMHLFVMIKTDAKMDDQLTALIKLQNPLVFHLLTKVTLHNEVSTHYEIDPLIYESTDVKLAIQKTDGMISIKPKQPIQFDIDAKDVSLSSKDIRINLTDFSLHHAENCQNSQCTVTRKFAIPSMAIEANQTNFVVTDTYLVYSSSTNADNKNTYKIDLGLAKIVNAKTQFGPFVMNFEINNLDGVALNKVITNSSSNKSTSPFLTRLIANLPQLLTKDFTMTDDALFTMPGGNVAIHGKLLWPVNVPLPQDLSAIKQNINAGVSLHIDTDVVNQIMPKIAEHLDATIAAQQAKASLPVTSQANSGAQSISLSTLQKQWDDLVKQGYFVQDNTGYAMNLTYENGALKTNGKMLDFSRLAQENQQGIAPKHTQKNATKAP
ncbi:MAG: DUF945 family protein [Gammaproteobacteria bacterium]|nr:DUF945 family protein [Gammaproteobacteria bacterium]